MGRMQRFKSQIGTSGGEQMMDCLFCKIVEGTIPSTKIYDDPEILGFKDINPAAPVHYLFVPKEHFPSLVELPMEKMEVVSKLYKAITQVAKKEGLTEKGYRTIINVGKHGGQVVYHLHVHLLGGRPLGGLVAGA